MICIINRYPKKTTNNPQNTWKTTGQWDLDCVKGAHFLVEICIPYDFHQKSGSLEPSKIAHVSMQDYAPQCSQKNYNAYDCRMIKDVYSNSSTFLGLSHNRFLQDIWTLFMIIDADDSCASQMGLSIRVILLGYICWTRNSLAHGCVRPESIPHTVSLMQNANPARRPPVSS